jgi:threonine dehydratase
MISYAWSATQTAAMSVSATSARTKIVVEGAAAAPVAALLNGLVEAPAGSKVVAVLSGGNIDLEQLRGLTWN